MVAATARAMITAAVTAALAAGVLAAPATEAQAGGKYGPRLVDKYAMPPVRAGATTWVKTFWTSRSDVCDVRVTVSGDGVNVKYPSNTDTYTSFSRSGDLDRGHFDYTAFRVTAPDNAVGWIALNLSVEYTNLPAATRTPDPDCTGRRSHRETTARLYVRH
jgi:hypothetical protein